MELFRCEEGPFPPLHLAISEVEAGFPSMADDHPTGTLNLHELLVPRPASTFFVKAKGDSMIGAGILPGDLLIVDKSKSPQSGHIIIALYQGEFTVKKLLIENKKIFLKAENPRFPLIAITQPEQFQVWGTVTYVIHPV